ncbi:MAG TPA: hypothetical protein VGW75_05060 [Solirubrobacteraceae bacterium]|nr:hypothetical protein [Solirubrobacteraceae bacterium]
MYGPFKRLQNDRTQTANDMEAILRTGELWGRIPYGGHEPAAQAYTGALAEDESGFEFYADVPPHNPWVGTPRWRPRPDRRVWVDGDTARVKIFVSRVRMSIG